MNLYLSSKSIDILHFHRNQITLLKDFAHLYNIILGNSSLDSSLSIHSSNTQISMLMRVYVEDPAPLAIDLQDSTNDNIANLRLVALFLWFHAHYRVNLVYYTGNLSIDYLGLVILIRTMSRNDRPYGNNVARNDYLPRRCFLQPGLDLTLVSGLGFRVKVAVIVKQCQVGARSQGGTGSGGSFLFLAALEKSGTHVVIVAAGTGTVAYHVL